MKLWHVLLAAMFVLLSAATVSGAEEVKKTGLVKGVITLEGLPTSEVVVSIEGLPAEYIRTHGSKTESRVMDQRLLNFVPKVLPIVVGTSVSFPNSDNTWHNVFSKSRAKEFDVGLYPPGESRSVMFDRPGVVRVLCNVHPTMEAHIVVKEHPFFTVPGANGIYQIGDIPMGRYRLEVWHPDVGTKVEAFNMVRDGEIINIDVRLLRNQ